MRPYAYVFNGEIFRPAGLTEMQRALATPLFSGSPYAAGVDLHVRFNVRASFSITLGVNVNDKLALGSLRHAVSCNLNNLIEAAGGIGEFIDGIEIAEVATNEDRTIVCPEGADAAPFRKR